MLVEKTSALLTDFARWRRGVWVCLTVIALCVLSLSPYLTSSTELVRMRNALLLRDGPDTGIDWTPATMPADFLVERGPPDPMFVEAVNRLGLAAMASDWERAVAISQHLLGSSPVLSGGAIQSDLRDTYQRIINRGEGYCGDFADVFVGLAVAAGIPVRAWAFSFDGFGGHGHVWPEIWNRQLGRWQLVDVFNNYYFVGPEMRPLSALEFRRAMLEAPRSVRLVPLAPKARAGWKIEEKAWEYYQRGLPEWYLWWGNNVFSYDRAPMVKATAHLSRSVEQFMGILDGVHPRISVWPDPDNRAQYAAFKRLRVHLMLVAGLGAAALVALISCLTMCFLAWRRNSTVASQGR